MAQNLAQTGHSVILIDLSDPILERARRDIAHGLRFKGFFEKAKKRTDARDVLERIEFTTDVRRLAGVDFVIENVTEKWEIKNDVYEQIDPICPERCTSRPTPPPSLSL